MRRSHLFLALALGGIGVWVYFHLTSTDALASTDNWEKAVREAKSARKPILLNFSGDW